MYAFSLQYAPKGELSSFYYSVLLTVYIFSHTDLRVDYARCGQKAKREKKAEFTPIFVFFYINMIILTQPRLALKDDSQILHWRVYFVIQNKKYACGKITPQWRLSLDDLGQAGNGDVSRHNCFATPKIIIESTNTRLSKLWASCARPAATRRLWCFRSRNAPGANSHGG